MSPQPNVFIFEQDSLNTKFIKGGLKKQWIADWLDSPDDEYNIFVEYEDDKVVIFQAIEVDEGESYKFIGTK